MKSWFMRFARLRRAFLLVAAVLLVIAIFLPIWQITLGAPQYPPPEGPLEVDLYLYPQLGGDYEEVNRLNAYVGFYYPDPVLVDPDFPIHEHSIETPEWAIAPFIFVILAALTLFVAVAPTTRKLKLGLLSLFIGTMVVFVGALVAVQARLYQAGHNLDPDAPMHVEGFTPPVLGSYEVANISGFAWLGAGAWLTLAAVVLMFLALLLRNSDVTFRDMFSRMGNRFRQSNKATNAEAVFSLGTAGMLAVLIAAPLLPAGPPDFTDQHRDDDPVVEIAEPPPVADDAVATIGTSRFTDAQRAIDAAEPGETIELEGRFDERLVIDTDDITLRAGDEGAVVDAGGQDRVVTIDAEDVTLQGLWIRGSGDDLGNEDAGVFVTEHADGAELVDLYLGDIAFGVWVDGAHSVTIADCTIRGRDDVFPTVSRGNGIQLWNADDATIENNHITEVRDGIYFSWAERVVASGNHLHNNRYGVHYMYSNDNVLEANTAVDNDVGYALMVSNHLEIVDNTAISNSGASGHGILVKDIDDSVIRGNAVVDNANGLYVYHSQNNQLESNLMLNNEVGIHLTAGSEGQTVRSNSLIANDEQVIFSGRNQEKWNENYWSDARAIDLTGDGISQIRYRPSGLVEHLIDRVPVAAAFANSPAFDAIRLAEDSFPVIEVPGVIDKRPLTAPPHSDWQRYETGR